MNMERDPYLDRQDIEPPNIKEEFMEQERELTREKLQYLRVEWAGVNMKYKHQKSPKILQLENALKEIEKEFLDK